MWNKMVKFLLTLIFCLLSSAEKHFLKFYEIGSSGLPHVSQVEIVAEVDGSLVGYCNRTDIRITHDWAKKFLDDDVELLTLFKMKCFHQLPNIFQTKISDLKQRLKQPEELPTLSLLQRSPSDPVSCHATGFYPEKARLFWRKDGEQIHQFMNHEEILPNNDGTFQMSADLDVSSVSAADWWRYDCVFQLLDAEDKIILRLDEAVIKTNRTRQRL